MKLIGFIGILLIGFSGFVFAQVEQDKHESNDCDSPSVLAWIESQRPTSDKNGHGPDIGSREWRGVILHRLGVKDPHRQSLDEKQWCAYVLKRIKSQEN